MNLTAFCQRCSKTATHVSDAFKCRFESISDAIYLILFDEKKHIVNFKLRKFTKQ